MTLIDWSDAECMFGMLVDLVADERAEIQSDPERLNFVEDLLGQLQTMEAKLPTIPATEAILRLRELYESIDPEFAEDSVVVHLSECIDELEKN